ncbi:MAG: hypothetical protein HWE14_00490 [Flavobacteriia bacterium]|nr:hypothetical protein [Flavobacteriia bacterium]
MKNNAVIYTVLATLVLAIIAYFLFRVDDHWYYTLDADGETPYDMGMYHELIEARNGSDIEYQSGVLEQWDWDIDSSNRGTIAFVDRSPVFDSVHEFFLDSMVAAGNVVVMYEVAYTPLWHQLITEGRTKITAMSDTSSHLAHDSVVLIQQFLRNQTYGSMLPTSDIEDKGQVKAVNARTKSKSTFNYANENDTLLEIPTYLDFHSVNKAVLDTLYDEYEVISYWYEDENEIISWKVPRGEGYYVVVLAAPHFTNYCLNTEENFDYVSDFATHLPSGFYWHDEYWPAHESDRDRSNGASGERSPISFLLSYRSLRWAWYVLVGSLVVFLIFRTQRRQRVIPIINRPKNQTLEFAKSLGILQSKSANNHALLAIEIKLQFAQWCKTRMRRGGKIDNQLRDTLKVMLPEQSAAIESLFYLFTKAELHPEDFNAEDLNKVYSVTRYIYNHV